MTITENAGVRADEVHLRPPAVAKVWLGRGQAHETVAVPGVTLGAGDVVVAVELATVCGSDVHTVSGHRSAPTPLVLGHEYVGRIVAIGAAGARDVDGDALELGDRIVWSLCVSCGHCDRCAAGIPQKCRSVLKYGHERIGAGWELTGGFATHVHVREGTTIVRVGERLPADILAPASCATATAWAALARVERVRSLDGAVVLVTGAGLVGLTVTAMAADRGATVIVSDPSKERRRRAVAFGASATVDPACTAGKRALDTARATTVRGEIDVVVDASGSAQAVAAGLEALAVGGVAVLVGSVSPGSAVTVDPERIVRGLLTITGVHNYAPADLRGAVDYLRTRGSAWPFAGVIGETFPLSQIDAAVERAARGDHLRVGVDPRR